MARPLKQGIDYFPLSVDFLRDIKVRKIKRACGSTTVEILLCLLGNIYRETGYYIGWDEDTMFLVADEVGAKEGLVEEIVYKALQVGFFDQEKFQRYKILTSRGIQKRYLEATKKRKEVVISDIYFINDTLKEEETPVNGVDNEQSKVNKSKGKKRKENKTKEPVFPLSKPSVPARHKYGEYKNVLLSDEELEKLQQEFPNDWQQRIERVSEYCASQGKSYKNYLATIRNWAKREKQQPKPTGYPRQPIRQEQLPDWVSNPAEEKKLSPEEQARLEQELQELLGE